MRLPNMILWRLTVVCVLAYPVAGAEDVSNKSAPVEWTTPGTEWLIKVKQYSRAAGKGYGDPRMAERALIPKVKYEFHMRITVLEPRGEGDKRIARIRFAPLEDAPESLRGESRVLELEASTGQPKAIKDKKGSALRGASTIGTERVLFADIYGFPIDWIVSAADLAQIPTRTQDRSVIDKTSYSFVKKLRPTATADGKQPALEIEASISWLDAAPNRRIVQTWVPGEGWWRSFTRYYYTGNPDLEATRVDSEDE